MPSPERLAQKFGEEYHSPVSTVSMRKEGDAYIVSFPHAGVTVEVSNVEVTRADTHALARITSTQPGTPALVYYGRVNLSGSTTRATLAKYLNARSEGDWLEIVERFCVLILDAIREGQPSVLLTDVKAREAARFRVSPLLIEGFPNVIFGPGGSGKSLLGATIALAVGGSWQLCDLDVLPGPVYVCDWELDDVTYREVCERLCKGFGIELPPIHYRQCAAPLVEEAQAIGRYAAREGIELIIVDSLGFAIGGDKTSQELTMRMFGAMRTWRKTDGSQITVLGIDHITNDEAQGNRPYGSVYTQNAARSLWRVRASQEEGAKEIEIGLFNTKANFGKQPPVGFRVRFDEDATLITREDVREMSGMRESLSASMRIKTALMEQGGLTKTELADRTGLDEKIVSARLSDLKRRGDITSVHKPEGAAAWWLASDREEPQ